MLLPVRSRPFASVSRLPFLAALQVRHPDIKPRGARRLVAKAVRFLWGLRRRLPAPGEVTFRLGDGETVYARVDARMLHYIDYASRERHGGYEPAETALIEFLLPRVGAFFDIGANWGYFTWLAATHPDFSGRIFSFEISPDVIAELRSIRTAGRFDNVEILPFGLSDRDGTAAIAGGGHDHLTRVSPDSIAGGTTAQVRTLDGLSGLPPPGLIKMDVEDHEPAVLRGASALVREHRPAILFECRDTAAPEVLPMFEQLAAAQYELFTLRRTDHGISLEPADIARPAEIPSPCNLFAASRDRFSILFP